MRHLQLSEEYLKTPLKISNISSSFTVASCSSCFSSFISSDLIFSFKLIEDIMEYEWRVFKHFKVSYNFRHFYSTNFNLSEYTLIMDNFRMTKVIDSLSEPRI